MLVIVQFSVPFVVPKGRPRFGKGRTFTPKKTAKAEKAIRDAYRGACIRKYGHVVTAPERAKVMVAATFSTPAPKARPRWVPKVLWELGAVPFVTTPDTDNLLKLVCDGLNPYRGADGETVNVAWHDDSQVVETHAYKLDRQRGGREETNVIVYWEDDDEQDLG